MSDQQKFETWAVVEVMGHSRYAGYCVEQAIGGASFLRVDIPAMGDKPAFTKILGTGSIFAITPCDEAFARAMAASFRATPFNVYEMPQLPHREKRDVSDTDLEAEIEADIESEMDEAEMDDSELADAMGIDKGEFGV